jgi:hypothetical protein
LAQKNKMKVNPEVMSDLLGKWIEIFGYDFEYKKTFTQNGGWANRGNKLISFIHKHFRVNVEHKEIMESTLPEQAIIIQKRIKENPDPDDLPCIKKITSKEGKVKPSIQQKALFEKIMQEFLENK